MTIRLKNFVDERCHLSRLCGRRLVKSERRWRSGPRPRPTTLDTDHFYYTSKTKSNHLGHWPPPFQLQEYQIEQKLINFPAGVNRDFAVQLKIPPEWLVECPGKISTITAMTTHTSLIRLRPTKSSITILWEFSYKIKSKMEAAPPNKILCTARTA